MQVLLTNIDAALREEDIEGRIALGAPENEYDAEAKAIVSALSAQQTLTETQIVAIIARIWAKAFDRTAQEIEQRMPAFRHIAQQILVSN